VTENYFDSLGVRALYGRPLARDDAQAAVLSYRFWQRRFNSDPKAVGQTRGIPNRQIRLRGGAKVIQRLKKTKARFRYHRPTVVSHAANRLGHPGRIAREKFIVFRRTQKANDAKLNHEIVDDLLSLGLGEGTRCQVSFEVDVQKG